jgi:hypothetical protein
MAVRSSSQATAAATTVAPAKPASLADGDVLLFLVAGGWGTVTPTDSMTQVGTDQTLKDDSGTAVGKTRVYRRVVVTAASEPSTYIFTQDTSNAIGVICIALSGRNTSAPISSSAGFAPATAALVINAPSLTGVLHDDLIVFGCGRDGNRSWTPPAGMTELQDVQLSTGGGVTLTAASLPDLAAGATGAKKLIESFPTYTPTDTFNRSTGLGTNWSQIGGLTHQLTIDSNLYATGDPAPAVGGSYWNPATFGPNAAVRATMQQLSTTNGNGVKLLARMSTPAASPRGGYSMTVKYNSTSGSHDWALWDEGTGNPQLGSTVGQTVGVGDLLEFRVTDNVLQGWLFPATGDPVLVLSYVDASNHFPSAGNCGLLIWPGVLVDSVQFVAVSPIGQPAAYSVAVAVVSGSPSVPVNSVLPAITGTANIGSVLTCSTGTWTNTPTSYTYQWQRDDGTGTYANIGGATSNTYTVQVADDLLHLRCLVTAVNGSGSSAPATAAPVGPVGAVGPSVDSQPIGPVINPNVVPTNTVPPSITGDPVTGATLLGNDGLWSGDTSRSHQWQTDKTGSWADIPGEIGQSYQVRQGDVGYDLRFKVTGTSNAGSTAVTSASVGPVIAIGEVVSDALLEEQDFGTSFADAAYAELEPVAGHDAALGNPLLTYLRSVGIMFQRIDYFGRTDSAKDAWAALLDLEHTPDDALPWLGQFLGVEVDLGKSAAQQRDQITGVSGWARGSATAMRNAVAPLLTGNQQVIFSERDGDPYTLTVITRSTETPDSSAVLAALLALKPAGIKLNYLVSTGNTYLEVRVTYATYTALRSAFATYAALRGY